MTPSEGDRSGDWALSLGIAAVLIGFVPGVGDFIAAPLACVAIVLGLVGVRRYEMRHATRVVPAVAGLLLGAVAVMALVLFLAATRLSPVAST